MAVGDELVIAHPLGHTEAKTAIAVVAGFFLRRPPEDEDADADNSPAAFAH